VSTESESDEESSESDEESSEMTIISAPLGGPPLGGPLSVGAGDASEPGDAASTSLAGVAVETVDL
jgi:hypothetical protein